MRYDPQRSTKFATMAPSTGKLDFLYSNILCSLAHNQTRHSGLLRIAKFAAVDHITEWH